jgi:hypothetical protein
MLAELNKKTSFAFTVAFNLTLMIFEFKERYIYSLKTIKYSYKYFLTGKF